MPARKVKSLYTEKGSRAHREHRAKKFRKSSTSKIGFYFRRMKKKATEELELEDQISDDPAVKDIVGKKAKPVIIKKVSKIKISGNKLLSRW